MIFIVFFVDAILIKKYNIRQGCLSIGHRKYVIKFVYTIVPEFCRIYSCSIKPEIKLSFSFIITLISVDLSVTNAQGVVVLLPANAIRNPSNRKIHFKLNALTKYHILYLKLVIRGSWYCLFVQRASFLNSVENKIVGGLSV